MPTNPVFRAQQPEPVGEANTATPTIGGLQILTAVPDNWDYEPRLLSTPRFKPLIKPGISRRGVPVGQRGFAGISW
jgi:hypothetical protein